MAQQGDAPPRTRDADVPPAASAFRLIGAGLAESHEVWDIGKRYFDLTQYREKMPQTRQMSQEIRKVSGKEVEVPGIGSEDRIEVQVWKNPDLSRTVAVCLDGKISLPLIGDTPAAGQTAAQLTETVTGKLKTYYKEPAQVTVIVNHSNSYAIYILGEVHTQGKHVVRSGTTFLPAVSLVRDFIAFASARKITLRYRGSACKETFITMLYKDILTGQQANLVV